MNTKFFIIANAKIINNRVNIPDNLHENDKHKCMEVVNFKFQLALY